MSLNARTLIVTVCEDPVLFVYADKNQTFVMTPDEVHRKQKEILKDIEDKNAVIVEGEQFSSTAICGTLF